MTRPVSVDGLAGLEITLDAELRLVAGSLEPGVPEPPETLAYDVRLHSLHDAVVALEHAATPSADQALSGR